MSCTNGLLTTTSGSAAGRVLAELRLAPREYLLHPPKSAINARPAATHSLADARPLVFRPMCSARSDPSSVSVSVAISLVLPINCSCYLHNLNQSINAPFPGSDQPDRRGLSSPTSTRCCAGLVIALSFRPPHRSIDGACPAQRINAKATARIESPETSSTDSGLEECGTSPPSMVDSWLNSLAIDCSLLNDGFHQNRNGFRQSDRHAAGSDSIFAALSSGLRQRAFLSAARIDGLAKHPARKA